MLRQKVFDVFKGKRALGFIPYLNEIGSGSEEGFRSMVIY